MMKVIFNFINVVLVGLALLLPGCGEDGPSAAETVLASQTTTDAIANYAAIVHQSYVDSHDAAEDLDLALNAFTTAPTEITLAAARTAWLESREPYLQTEVYRFYDGPIDVEPGGPEGDLNAWPMDEAHVDYVVGDATAGIINGTDTIDAASLRGFNGPAEESVATGYHPIEFLLWGQDLNASPGDAGMRPATDFLTVGGTASNQDRRVDYLLALGDVLLEDLQSMVDAWAPNDASNYRAEFEAAGNAEAVRRILTGMVVLAGFETAGERLAVALGSGEQEDEHSCFSDNTHRDMVGDVIGIQNVWLGRYGSITGAGMNDVVAALDPALATRITAEIAAARASAEALRPTMADTPFDELIDPSNTAGNALVQDLIDDLRTVEGSLTEAFAAFGLTAPTPE